MLTPEPLWSPPSGSRSLLHGALGRSRLCMVPESGLLLHKFRSAANTASALFVVFRKVLAAFRDGFAWASNVGNGVSRRSGFTFDDAGESAKYTLIRIVRVRALIGLDYICSDFVV